MNGALLCSNREGWITNYNGVLGMLTGGDCGALYHMASFLSRNWRINNQNMNEKNVFRYVETGAYQGLSAHVVGTALKNSIGSSNAIIYSHDLFDEYIPPKDVSIIESSGLWDRYLGQEETRLEKFHSNVRRNGLEKIVVPISGPSSRTLRIHPNNSVHFVFIDGDHTYQGLYF